MNWLDIFLSAAIAGSTIGGLMKGFARVTIGLAATVLAFLLASWYYVPAGEWSLPYVSAKGVANCIGFVTVFGGVAALGALLGRLAAKFFKWVGLSWLDRLAGGALGVLRGGLVGLVVVLMLSAFLPGDPPKVIAESQIAPYILDGANVLSIATPKEMKEQFRQTYEKLKKHWLDPIRKHAPTDL
ncbi:MAG: CvpA family protein [Acidobacteria bacterium]|nr:CvpA family protein [Acidobacteriota bacterium]